jgi:colanic acid/amylovoran biosynthesis glycosyltransferase
LKEPLLRIGYLVNTYPRPSHSFIRREITALERHGFSVHRMAMRGDAEALRDPADLAEHALTEHVLDAGGRRLLLGLLRHGVMAPDRLGKALRMARDRANAGESSLARQLIYMAEGAYVARRAKASGLCHIHAHFGTNSTRVAAYARIFGGPPFSFTVHGPEEFDNVLTLDLGGKLALADSCITVSSYGRSQMYRWAAASDWPKVQVVHCGLDLTRWTDPAPLPLGAFQMVAVGRFAEQKGFGLLMRAFAVAWRQDPTLSLTLVGDGELRDQINTLIADEGMERAVTLLGWQDETGVRAAMNAAHALVTPSFAEGLPVVIMEAMACARPIIATSIAGIPELVRHGQEGWLVPAGDVDALSATMLKAASTPIETLAAMGDSARKRVCARHDIETSVQRLAEIFNRSTG